MKNILITGSAGFIGSHLTKKLLLEGNKVLGIDNLNTYYDPSLKKARLKDIKIFTQVRNLSKNYTFSKTDLTDKKKLSSIFSQNKFDILINLAAQPGVRYSLENPQAYFQSNLIAFGNLLEEIKKSNIDHFLFASSSSVYGINKVNPFNTSDNTDFPVSLYAATKKSNEVIAHSYSHLYDIPTTGLRFFTVYGPFGRPDMAYYKFTKAILEGKPIDVFNQGKMKRDFTYIDDVTEGISRLINKIPKKINSDTTASKAKFKIYNIGNNNPVTLKRFIKSIEVASNKKAIENNLPMQDGDVPLTFANIDELIETTGFAPSTSIEMGMKKFVEWYKENSMHTLLKNKEVN
tara:strand:+ start:2306 stop:3346 length:1041 start_codon:yes stop_codon:yes gene_type:complete